MNCHALRILWASEYSMVNLCKNLFWSSTALIILLNSDASSFYTGEPHLKFINDLLLTSRPYPANKSRLPPQGESERAQHSTVWERRADCPQRSTVQNLCHSQQACSTGQRQTQNPVCHWWVLTSRPYLSHDMFGNSASVLPLIRNVWLTVEWHSSTHNHYSFDSTGSTPQESKGTLIRIGIGDKLDPQSWSAVKVQEQQSGNDTLFTFLVQPAAGIKGWPYSPDFQKELLFELNINEICCAEI